MNLETAIAADHESHDHDHAKPVAACAGKTAFQGSITHSKVTTP